MNRPPDIEGQFFLFPSEDGGRKSPVSSGYRPQHKIHDNYQTSGHHEYVDATQVALGESASAKVWFITPDVYPNSLWIGREIGIYEASHQVGTLTVTRILNEALIGSPDTYNPAWVKPEDLDVRGRKIVS